MSVNEKSIPPPSPIEAGGGDGDDVAHPVPSLPKAGDGTGDAGKNINTERESIVKELKVSRRSTRDFNVPVFTKGATVSWTFRLKEYDVNFGVSFIPSIAGVSDVVETTTDNSQTVRPVVRICNIGRGGLSSRCTWISVVGY